MEPGETLSKGTRDALQRFGISESRWDAISSFAATVISTMLEEAGNEGNRTTINKHEVLSQVTTFCQSHLESALAGFTLGEYFGQKEANPFRSLLQQAGVI